MSYTRVVSNGLLQLSAFVYATAIHFASFAWGLYCLAFGIFAVCSVDGWNVADAFYFTLSTLSTAGSWPIPATSPNWLFVLVAIWTAIGVPLNFVAMNIMTAFLLTDSRDSFNAIACISEPVTADEHQRMFDLRLGTDDGKLSYEEYVIISSLRLGILDLDVLKQINNRFDQLDVNASGCLSYSEIRRLSQRSVQTGKTAWEDTVVPLSEQDICKE